MALHHGAPRTALSVAPTPPTRRTLRRLPPPGPIVRPTCSPACAGTDVCLNGVCTAPGPLGFWLLWSTGADMDLQIVDPDGCATAWNTQCTSSTLLKDCSGGCALPQQEMTTVNSPRQGTYTIRVVRWSGTLPISYSVYALVNGVDTLFSGTIDASTPSVATPGCTSGCRTATHTLTFSGSAGCGLGQAGGHSCAHAARGSGVHANGVGGKSPNAAYPPCATQPLA